MVILPYFDPMEKLKFQFPLNLTSTNTKVMISGGKSRKACKTGVIHVISSSI